MFFSQVQKFLKSDQKEAHVALCSWGEMVGESDQEAEDVPQVIGEDERITKMRKNVKKKKEARTEQSSDTEQTECTQPSTSFSSAPGTMDTAEQDDVQPARQLTCLECPDFLFCDTKEGGNGKQ